MSAKERHLFVPGVPAPQGSKRHVGRGIMVESSKAVGPWRERVALAFAELLDGESPTRAAVVLNARFTFTRPKSHLRANGVARESAPATPVTRPDLDKLCRAILDALSGVAIVDDSQVVAIVASKEYGGAPGVYLRWRYA